MGEHEQALQAALARFISEAAGVPVTVSRLLPLSGGASQEAWSLAMSIADGEQQTLVLRRDLGGALSSAVLPRRQEYAALCAMHAAGVCVPRPYWFSPDLRVGDEAHGAPRAAFLMGYIGGETIGRRIVQSPALAEARARLPEQLAETLASIHGLDPRAYGLDWLAGPASGQSAAMAALDQLAADLQALDEPHPALELGLRWLRAQAPAREQLMVLHGDFRVGNFVVGPEGLRGVLDWENVHLGDRHADLGWLCVRAWRFGQDHLPVGGICTRATFLDAYEAASGRTIDRQRVCYWEILGNLRWAIGALGQAQRHRSGVAPSIELASLGRICAEMELELLNLIDVWEAGVDWRAWEHEEAPYAG
jgi:aminoglycoside phosphotransferase (APT) family kinase protein